VEDLAGKEIFLPPGAPAELANPLNARLKQMGLAPVRLRLMDENLRVDDVLEMVNAGLIPMTAVEAHIGQIWSTVFTSLRVHPEIEMGEAPIGWAVRKGSPKLLAALNEFVKSHKVGTAYGSTVMRRYYSNAKWVRQATSKEDVAKFKQMLELFRKYGNQYELPYLLVAAQAYQESRLNQSLRSPAGAVGVMQIKPSTAAGNPINVTPVTSLENNIKAGVKYLRYIADTYFAKAPMDPVNRALFSVASYNAGPNRIERLRAEAKESGFDENKWFNNVEVIAAKRIGRETTSYVANIYKYYLAYKQITEAQEAGKAASRK
jgi:membrane-bound lytic murein transglycosylase MltF